MGGGTASGPIEETYSANVYFASARLTPDSSKQQDITIPLNPHITRIMGLEFLAQHPDGKVSVGELPSFARIPHGYEPEDQLTIYQIAYAKIKGSPSPIYISYEEFVKENMPAEAEVTEKNEVLFLVKEVQIG